VVGLRHPPTELVLRDGAKIKIARPIDGGIQDHAGESSKPLLHNEAGSKQMLFVHFM